MPRERGNGIFSLDTMSEERGMGGGEERGRLIFGSHMAHVHKVRMASHFLLISYEMSLRHTMRRGTRRREGLRSLEATRPGDSHEGFLGAPHCSYMERYFALPSYILHEHAHIQQD